jgi:AraC-like DNA-binding protein
MGAVALEIGEDRQPGGRHQAGDEAVKGDCGGEILGVARLERLRLQELADLVGRSRFHFCRAFRDATGRTPPQALMLLRVKRARQLLANPANSVTEVALAVGYQTPSAFALAFRRAVGETPAAYRKRL